MAEVALVASARMESCIRQFVEREAVPLALEDILVVDDRSYAEAVGLVAFHTQTLADPCMADLVDACVVAFPDACILAVA